MTLILLDELNKSFTVRAKFYYSKLSGEDILMRREARIERIGSDNQVIDAVVVMINPGGCSPKGIVTHRNSNGADMIPANSDPTQHQLMNLMERRKWDVLVIVNLSDICEGDLTKFTKLEKKFLAENITHSIFQAENKNELTELLSSTEHLIFAWGSSTSAKKLSKQFGLFLNGKPTASYNHIYAWIDEEKGYPRHPKPALKADKIHWLNLMEETLTVRK